MSISFGEYSNRIEQAARLNERSFDSCGEMLTIDELAFTFFKIYSRTEYALKASGYLKNSDGDAEANWRKFALAIDSNALRQQKEVAVAIDHLEKEPPKKQVARNGILEWEPANPSTNLDVDRLLIYVRRVRNNVFHGGKFNGKWFEPERSEELIRCSLIILVACIDAVNNVKTAYYG